MKAWQKIKVLSREDISGRTERFSRLRGFGWGTSRQRAPRVRTKALCSDWLSTAGEGAGRSRVARRFEGKRDAGDCDC